LQKSATERDRTERLQFFLSADELAAVDEFRFQKPNAVPLGCGSRTAKAGTDRQPACLSNSSFEGVRASAPCKCIVFDLGTVRVSA
jgi:hypothetical protein